MLKQRFFIIGLILSIFLHLVYFYVLIPEKKPVKIEELKVDLIIEPQQIVENKIANEEQSDAKLLSEKDNKVEKETKKNGNDQPIAAAKSQKTTEPKKEAPPEKEKPEIQDEGSEVIKETKKPKKKVNLFDSSIINPSSGTQDKLDNIPSGGVTLLNTKANQFAGFVRRIAEAVFNDIKLNYLPILQNRNTLSNDGKIKFNVILNKSGKQLSNQITFSDIDNIVKNIVSDAIRDYCNDPNPPKAALATSGLFDFDFEFSTRRNYNTVTFELRVGLN